MKNGRTNQKCPKCGGSLFHVEDFNGNYEQCLQCGFIKYPSVIQLSEIEKEMAHTEA